MRYACRHIVYGKQHALERYKESIVMTELDTLKPTHPQLSSYLQYALRHGIKPSNNWNPSNWILVSDNNFFVGSVRSDSAFLVCTETICCLPLPVSDNLTVRHVDIYWSVISSSHVLRICYYDRKRIQLPTKSPTRCLLVVVYCKSIHTLDVVGTASFAVQL